VVEVVPVVDLATEVAVVVQEVDLAVTEVAVVVPEVVPVVASVVTEVVVVDSVAVVVLVVAPVVDLVTEVAVAVPVVVVVVPEVVPVVVLKLSLNHIDMPVSSLPEVKKIYWLLKTLPQVILSMVKKESVLKNQQLKKVLQLPKPNTEFGIHSDLNWLPVLWVV
jgi:hypothetical protein